MYSEKKSLNVTIISKIIMQTEKKHNIETIYIKL